MPTADLPGIGATILMVDAFMTSAISSLSVVILFTFTPGAGCNSYRVITGPLLIFTTLASMPKSCNVSSNILALLSRSSPSILSFSGGGEVNKSNVGNL